MYAKVYKHISIGSQYKIVRRNTQDSIRILSDASIKRAGPQERSGESNGKEGSSVGVIKRW